VEHINWTLGVIVPYINFLTFMIAAFFLFKKPITTAAKKAREVFDASSNEARREKESVSLKLVEVRKRAENLDKEIEEMKKAAMTSALTEEKGFVADGERLAQHIKDEAKRVIEAEIEKARVSIGVEIIELVKKEVKDRIQKDVGPEKHRQIINDRIRELDRIKH
jgi:F-type H+-transporting ATPase subunit b